MGVDLGELGEVGEEGLEVFLDCLTGRREEKAVICCYPDTGPFIYVSHKLSKSKVKEGTYRSLGVEREHHVYFR
jgi:hypothetical protein